MTDSNEKEWLRPKTISEKLDVSEQVLAVWRHRKTGPPFVKCSGRVVRYSASGFRQWIASLEEAGR